MGFGNQSSGSFSYREGNSDLQTTKAPSSRSSAIFRMDSPVPPMRMYQKELLDEATHGNVIIFLDTGTGKTRIAAELILQMRDQLESRSQIALFLAPSVPLAMQAGRSKDPTVLVLHRSLKTLTR